jgi:hypothetical protein
MNVLGSRQTVEVSSMILPWQLISSVVLKIKILAKSRGKAHARLITGRVLTMGAGG